MLRGKLATIQLSGIGIYIIGSRGFKLPNLVHSSISLSHKRNVLIHIYLKFNSVPETRKEKKIKQRKSPLKVACIGQLGAVSTDILNKYLEIECQLKSKDKEEKDKSDAKNELEELVYAIRK